jgi:hypothetical protein
MHACDRSATDRCYRSDHHHLLETLVSLVEKRSLVQHPNVICPGLAGYWGPMTRIGPGSCRLEINPGSFRGIDPGLWHEPGPCE